MSEGFEKIAGRMDWNPRAQRQGKVNQIACYKACGTRCDGYFQERFVIWIRQWLWQGSRSDEETSVFCLIKQGFDFFRIEPKFRTQHYRPVFGNNTGIEPETQFAGRCHAHDISAWAERRQEPGNQDIRVEDNDHRVRLLRTVLISASISSMVIWSVPCSRERC